MISNVFFIDSSSSVHVMSATVLMSVCSLLESEDLAHRHQKFAYKSATQKQMKGFKQYKRSFIGLPSANSHVDVTC